MKQAVILCGGLGSRLGALTTATPKPLLPVNGTPFLEILVRDVAAQGFDNFLLVAGFEGQQIEAFGRNLPDRMGMAVDVAVLVEPRRGGTGGALRFARDRLDDTFLLMNGDSWLDVRLADLVALLDSQSMVEAALALRRLDDVSRFGIVDMVGKRITAFGKPAAILGRPGLINGGVYAMRRSVADHCSEDCSLEEEVLPELVSRGAVTGLTTEGYFIDIGVPEDYALAQRELDARRTHPAFFLDRDGVLNEDVGYVGTIERFQWKDGAIAAIRAINRTGRRCFIVTNQAGIGKNLYSLADYWALRKHIREDLRQAGAWIDDERFCPDHPEATLQEYRRVSTWRKPGAGMIQDLLRHWPTDVGNSWMIGDRESDLAAAAAAGVRGRMFHGGRLDTFVREILAQGRDD